MRPAHPLEQAIGMGVYVTDVDGIGGHLRERPDDFRVEELGGIDPAPLDADRGGYPYLLIRVTLSNWDTNEFATTLADRLGMSRERVNWAGTKDRRAVTTQLFTLKGVDPADLPDMEGVTYSVLGRAGRALSFGDLAGNAFEVTMDAVTAPERAEHVTEALETYGDADARVGVPNFFGQQRFGSQRAITHLVGRHIIEEDWEGAVMAYVGNPSEYEPDQTREAREFVEETRDWGATVERFHGGLRHERAILSALAGGASFQAALDALPSNLQRLFVHAAQSDIFNRILTERLERGIPLDRPVLGDIVCFADERAGLTVPTPGRSQRVDEDRLDVLQRHCERGRAFVTAPLLGADSQMPDGEPGAITRAVLDEVGVDPRQVDLPEPYHSEGTRRAVLVRTDLELAPDGDRVTTRFSLPKGSYATVLLREYLKCDPRSL